jgi:alkylation response protein AidB-like acyl-CoA dehydrogenase
VDKLRKTGLGAFQIKDFGGLGLNSVETGAIVYELAKKDASVTTFLCVHDFLGMHVIDILGSQE